jgi:hypothetical protein
MSSKLFGMRWMKNKGMTALDHDSLEGQPGSKQQTVLIESHHNTLLKRK